MPFLSFYFDFFFSFSCFFFLSFPTPTVLPFDLKAGWEGRTLIFLNLVFDFVGDFSLFYFPSFFKIFYFLFIVVLGIFWEVFFLFVALVFLLFDAFYIIYPHDKLYFLRFSASLLLRMLKSSSTDLLFLWFWLVPLNLLFLRSMYFYLYFYCKSYIPIVVFFVLPFLLNFFFLARERSFFYFDFETLALTSEPTSDE